MVRFTLKRSLRAASCCRVEVMNGATGLRLFSRVCTDATMKSAPSTLRRSSRRRFFDSRSRRVSSFRLTKRAFRTGGFFACRLTSMVQYSRFWNARISRSRSTIRRSATVCTRPAESPRRTLSHSSGEIL